MSGEVSVSFLVRAGDAPLFKTNPFHYGPTIQVRLAVLDASQGRRHKELLDELAEIVRREIEIKIADQLMAVERVSYTGDYEKYVLWANQNGMEMPPTPEEWEAAYNKWREELVACRR